MTMNIPLLVIIIVLIALLVAITMTTAEKKTIKTYKCEFTFGKVFTLKTETEFKEDKQIDEQKINELQIEKMKNKSEK